MPPLCRTTTVTLSTLTKVTWASRPFFPVSRKMNTAAHGGRVRRHRFAPLAGGRKDANEMILKGVVFDMDGTLCNGLYPYQLIPVTR